VDLACVPPELRLGLPAALPVSDLWSLGATWACVYTGGGASTFPDMSAVAAAHAENAPEGSDPNEVALQGRVLAAVASIEAVMGPLVVAWPLSAALPAAGWVDAMLSTIRALKPGLAPVAPTTTPAEAADALRSRLLFMHGLRQDVADIVVRAMTVDPARRCGPAGGGARELVAAPVWKADVGDNGPASAAAVAKAREALLPRLDLGGEGGAATLVSGGAEADAALLAALPPTRWRSAEARIARAGVAAEAGEGMEEDEDGEEDDDEDGDSSSGGE
jgi:hypothetical protein